MNTVEDKQDPWWKRWFIQPILRQLTQGISVEQIAWTIAVGGVLGIFPIMGTTSLICLFAAWVLGLNQPVIQMVCHALWPVHLALILVFIRAGQSLFGADHITFSIPQLLRQFFDSPWQFAQAYALAACYGIIAWAIISIPLLLLIRAICLPLLRTTARGIQRRKEAKS